MLKDFITQKDGSVSLEDYQVALDEILRLRKRVAELEATQQSAPLTGLTWRCGVCYRVNNRSNKVCWFCETDPQVA